MHTDSAEQSTNQDDQLNTDWPREDGPWQLTFRWQYVGGHPEIVELTIKQTDRHAPAPITGRLLRAIPINRVFNQLVAYGQELRSHFPEQAHDGDWTPTVTPDPPPRRNSVESIGEREQRLGVVADVYTDSVPRRRDPTKAVAEHFGIPRSTAANWVQASRRARLLGPANGPRVPRAVPIRPI